MKKILVKLSHTGHTGKAQKRVSWNCHTIGFCLPTKKLQVFTKQNINSRFSVRIIVAGERCNVTGESWKESPRLNNNIVGHQTLAEEFCLVNKEFSDLQCLMNILLTAAEDVKVLLMRFLL